MRPRPSPRPPSYYGEARQKPRFMVPLIVGALLLAAIVAVPRLVTHRAAGQPAVGTTAAGAASSGTAALKSAPPPVASHSDAVNAKPAQLTATKSKAPADTTAKLKTDPPAAQPPKVEAVKSTSATAQPSGVPLSATSASAVAPEKTAKTAVPVAGSAKGEVLDQVLPDVSQKARDTIHGKVRLSVKVQVDPSGAVSGAELDSPGPSKFFADLAVEAARKWVFSPPEINGKSVASEWRLQFDFRQKATTVVPTQTVP